MKLFSFFLLLILISSCQTRSRKNNQISVVDLDESSSKPKVTDKDSKENVYGPLNEGAVPIEDSDKKIEKNPIIALHLAPALYNSFAYIELLDQMERLGVRPKIIVTSGFNSIVAALYAKYESANRVNFKMFSLLNQLKNKEAFSSDWMDSVSDFINDEFEEERQERLKIIVIIPAYKGRKVHLLKSGPLAQNIIDAIDLNRLNENFLLRPSLAYRKEVNQMGIDLSFYYSVFGAEDKISAPSGYLLGVYRKVRGFGRDPKAGFEQINVNNKNIDKVSNLVDQLASVRERSLELSEKAFEKIQKWKNK